MHSMLHACKQDPHLNTTTLIDKQRAYKKLFGILGFSLFFLTASSTFSQEKGDDEKEGSSLVAKKIHECGQNKHTSPDIPNEAPPNLTNSPLLNLDDNNKTDYRNLWSYRILASAGAFAHHMLSLDVLTPRAIIPVLLASKCVPSVIDRVLGANHDLGLFLKQAYHVTTFSLAAYSACMFPSEFMVALGVQCIADKLLTILNKNNLTSDERELVGGCLFVFEQMGNGIINRPIQSTLSLLRKELPFKYAEKIINDIILGGFQPSVWEGPYNESCPLSPLSTAQFCTAQSTESLWSYNCETSSVPPEYCLAFGKEIEDFCSVITPELLEKFSSPSKEKLGIVVGETHKKVSHFLAKMCLLKVAKSIGINNVLIELPPHELEQAIAEAKNPSSFLSLEPSLLVKTIQTALNLDMNIIPVDDPQRPSLPSLTKSNTCKAIETVFNENREGAMCNNTKNLRDNFITFLGHVHPSYLLYHCDEINSTHQIAYIHLEPTEKARNTASNTLKAFKECKPYATTRYNEFLSFLDEVKVQFFSFKANPYLDPLALYDLMVEGIVQVNEISEEFML